MSNTEREPFQISVECYAGYRGEQTPIRFRLGDRTVDIVDVIDRWLAPEYRYFKVSTADGVYILRQDMTSGGWGLTLFERGPGDENPSHRQRN